MGKEKNTVVRRYKCELPCKITEAEKNEFANKLAEAVTQRNDIAEQKKNDTANYNAEPKMLDKDIAVNSGIIHSGEQFRQVEVEGRRHLDLNRVLKIRLDTGEVVEDRALDASERQNELRLDGPMGGF